MRTVHKFPIPIDDEFALQLPAGAQLLCFAAQHRHPTLWALVDPDAARVTRRFRFAGTGHQITAALKTLNYIGTCFLDEGALVFHLFELVEAA